MREADDSLNPPIYRRFLAEMALIYFVSFQEAYVRDYLGAALAFRTELLKSDKTITFKEACDCASFDSLVEYLATKQAEDVTDNIDETAEYFEKRFNLPLASKFKQWTVLREASYRRNLVVHNGGIANKIYCAKIKGDAREGERLNTDVAYVVELADAILLFINYLHFEISQRISHMMDSLKV